MMSISDMVLSMGHKNAYLRGTDTIGASDIPGCMRKTILDRIIGSKVDTVDSVIVKSRGNIFETQIESALSLAGVEHFVQGKVRGTGPLEDIVVTTDIVIPLKANGEYLKGSKHENQEMFERMLSSGRKVMLVELKTSNTKPTKKEDYKKQILAQYIALSEHVVVEKIKLLAANLNKGMIEFDISISELLGYEDEVFERAIILSDALYCHNTGQQQEAELPIEISGLCIDYCEHISDCPGFTNGMVKFIDQQLEVEFKRYNELHKKHKEISDELEESKENLKKLSKKYRDHKGKLPTLISDDLSISISGGTKVKSLGNVPKKIDSYLSKKFPKSGYDLSKVKRDTRTYSRLIEKYNVEKELPLRISVREREM